MMLVAPSTHHHHFSPNNTFHLTGFRNLEFSTYSHPAPTSPVYYPQQKNPQKHQPNYIELCSPEGTRHRVRAELAVEKIDTELNFLFFVKQQIHPTRGEEEVELFNKNNSRFATLFFPPLNFKDGTASFQIGLGNKVGLQFGVAQPEGWDKTNKSIGHGVGDNDRSFGYDPIHALVWHDKKCFQYGEPCNVGDIIRCVTQKGETKSTVEFQRIVKGETEPTSFGIAFEFNNLEGLVPGISFARFQRIQLPHSNQCTTDLFGSLLNLGDTQVTSVETELAHVFYNHFDEKIMYHDAPSDVLHWACIFGHEDFISKMSKQMGKERIPAACLLKPNECGYTPVHMCVQGRQPKILSNMLQTLIDEKQIDKLADQRTTNKGTILHVAARIGSVACLKVLLSFTAIAKIINVCNDENQTPLYISLRNAHILFAELLIRGGAVVKYKDSEALSYIEKRTDSILLLLNHRHMFEELLQKLKPEDDFLKMLLSQKGEQKMPSEKIVRFEYMNGKRKVSFTTTIKYFSHAELVYVCTRAMRLYSPAQLFCFIGANGKKIPFTQICQHIQDSHDTTYEILKRALEPDAQGELEPQEGKCDRVQYNPIVPLGVLQ